MGFEIINRLKKEKGLTNAQLAELSGVTLSTLDKITAGINTNPKLETLQAICKALGCRLDDFDDAPQKLSKVSYDEMELLKKYRSLPDSGKEMVDMVLNKEYERFLSTPKEPAATYFKVAAYGGDGVERIELTAEEAAKAKESKKRIRYD